jgi:hypothetical protein
VGFIRLRRIRVTRHCNHPVNLDSQGHLLVVAELWLSGEIFEEKFENRRLKVID